MSSALRNSVLSLCKSKWMKTATLLRRQTLPCLARCKRNYGAEPLTEPAPSSAEKIYPEKIKSIVDDISKLTVIEVADLNELLKKTLNIQETAMMPAGFGMPSQPAAAKEEEEAAAPEVVKTSFTVKLMKFDESKKVALIKEIKNLIEGMNLVQAKKFVEGAPQVIQADISKEEAEKIKAAVEAVGGSCEID